MFVRLAIVFAASIWLPGIAAAQDAPPPARIGNIYNGTAHQPTAGGVHAAEQADGIATPGPERQAHDKALENQGQKIQQNGAQTLAPAESLACSTVPATCR